MRTPSLALVPVLLALVACQPGASPTPAPSSLAVHPENAWEAAVGLPTAAQACRDAGYAPEEVAATIEMSQEAGIAPASLARALAATADAAREYGPVGDLSGYMAQTLYRNNVRGEPLYRLIRAHHAAYGAKRLQIPPVQTPMPSVPPTDPNIEGGEPEGRGAGGES